MDIDPPNNSKHLSSIAATLQRIAIALQVSPGIGKFCPVHIPMQKQKLITKLCTQHAMVSSPVSDMRMFLCQNCTEVCKVCN